MSEPHFGTHSVLIGSLSVSIPSPPPIRRKRVPSALSDFLLVTPKSGKRREFPRSLTKDRLASTQALCKQGALSDPKNQTERIAFDRALFWRITSRLLDSEKYLGDWIIELRSKRNQYASMFSDLSHQWYHSVAVLDIQQSDPTYTYQAVGKSSQEENGYHPRDFSMLSPEAKHIRDIASSIAKDIHRTQCSHPLFTVDQQYCDLHGHTPQHQLSKTPSPASPEGKRRHRIALEGTFGELLDRPFRSPHLSALFRLLLVSALHPLAESGAYEYVQGINELGAMIYWVMWSGREPEGVPDPLSTRSYLSSEADTFFLLQRLLRVTSAYWQKQPEAIATAVLGDMRRLDRLIAVVFPPGGFALKRAGIGAEMWGIGWVTSLFCQVMTLEENAGIWDFLMATLLSEVNIPRPKAGILL
eukprot:gnl/Dysnectes_brevis/7069_a11508_211.p1 GENE.gnl/Dysnectes_brevis/7069_a11508_211~~gnl/Dysnectes_brevis/7069_a11508_211.p1  ORF type:complete len:415 (-),score=40.92 gnl/Dysnectes_brevis/7069_a11508_211:7-1251(-)